MIMLARLTPGAHPVVQRYRCTTGWLYMPVQAGRDAVPLIQLFTAVSPAQCLQERIVVTASFSVSISSQLKGA